MPKWTALNQCIALFKKKPSDAKGIYYGGPWDYGDADIIRALNINFEISRLANGTELWQQLEFAIAKQQLIVLLNWSPNSTDKYANGSFIQFAEYEEQCEVNPDWGLNKYYVKDCGNRQHGWLKKPAAKTLQQYNQCVFQFIKQVNFTKEMMVDASSLVVVNKLNEEEAANRWIETHMSEISGWRLNTCL